MKKLLIILLAFNLLSGAAWDVDKPSDDALVQAYKDKAANLIKPTDKAEALKQSKYFDELAVEREKNIDNANKKEEYFQENVMRAACVNLEALKCPSLKIGYKGNYSVRTDYINPIAGEVQCSVFDMTKNPDFKNFKMIDVIKTRVFKQEICKEEFNPSKADIYDNSPETNEIRKNIASRQLELSQQQMKYEIDYKQSGGESYLDMGDLLDALSTVDGEKINIKETLNQWEVKMNSGFTIKPNAMVIERAQGNVETLLKYYNGELLESELENEMKNRVQIRNKNEILLNSQYVMYLDFFTRGNEAMGDALNYVLVLFVGWNLIASMGFNAATAKLSGQQNNENIAGRVGFGVLIFLAFFVGSSERMELPSLDADENRKTIELKTQRIQFFMRYIYSLSNEVSDTFAKIGISSYLKGLNATSGVATIEMLDSLTAERNAIRKETDTFLRKINDMCLETYNVRTVQKYMAKYRESVLSTQNNGALQRDVHWSSDITNFIGYTSDSAGYGTAQANTASRTDYGDLDLNPWPTSEREAYAMNRVTGHNPYSSLEIGGVMNKGYLSSANFNQNFMSLSGCSYNKKKLMSNMGRLSVLDKKISDIGDPVRYDKQIAHLKIIHDMMWKNYADLGYVSIAFLPATAIMIDQMGSLGDSKEREAKLDEIDDGGIGKSVATALPMLTMFGGNEIARMINNLISSGDDFINAIIPSSFQKLSSAVSMVSKVFFRRDFSLDKNGNTTEQKSTSSQPGIASYTITYFLIDGILKTLPLVVLITGSLLAFMILALQKLWTFMATMFLAIYMFHENQQQKLAQSMGKMIAIAFKGVLLVVSVFIAIYSMNLLDSLQAILVNDFFNNMGTMYDANNEDISVLSNPLFVFDLIRQTFQKYSYIGVATVGFMVVKIYLAYHIIFKLPEFFYEILETSTGSASNQLSDTIQSAAEGQNLKGM